MMKVSSNSEMVPRRPLVKLAWNDPINIILDMYKSHSLGHKVFFNQLYFSFGDFSHSTPK